MGSVVVWELSCWVACGILVPETEIESMSSALEGRFLTREVPVLCLKLKKKKVFKVRIKFAFILKTSYWKLLITLKRQNCSLSFCLCLVFISSDTLILLISWCEKSGALLLDLWYLGLLPPALSLDGNQKHQIWGASLPQVTFECKRLGSQCFMGWSNCVPEF